MKYCVGQLVVNRKLGLGKVLAVTGDSVTVFFKDQPDNPRTINVAIVPMEIPQQQSDPWLDHLDLSVAAVGRARHYLTHEQAVQKFLRYFPLGFNDPNYIGDAKHGERHYKLIAHELWHAKLNQTAYRELLDARDFAEITHRALQVEAKTNLLAPFEKAALREAVASPSDAESFAVGLYDLIYDDEPFELRFTRFAGVLGRLPQPKTPLRWTVQTIFPFLALPKEHLFLKPGVTQEAAERRAFSLNYRPQPNWLTYSCLLRFGEVLMGDLAALGARDMIDIQSFIFITGDKSSP